MSRRSRFTKGKLSQPPKNQARKVEKRDKYKGEKWRSASTHILVELQETLIKNGGKINIPIINRTIDIFRKIAGVFSGTGYDEVFAIMIKVFEESIFSRESQVFDEGKKSLIATPYFHLYKNLLEEKKNRTRRNNNTIIRPSYGRPGSLDSSSSKSRLRSSSIGELAATKGEMITTSSSGGELMQNYSAYQTKKLNQMRKTMASKESALHDLQYDRYILNEENQDLKKNLTREKDTHTKAYSDLIKICRRKDEEIKVLREQIVGLMEYRKMIETSKVDYLKDKQTNTQLDHKNMFSTVNQIRTLRKFHQQLEVIENQRINDYTNKSFAILNDKPKKTSFFLTEEQEKTGVDRSANLSVERRKLKDSFVNQVNLLNHQMNLMKDRIKKLMKGDSDITIDGRKLEIQAESSSDSQERREALKQRVKNFSFDDKTYRFHPFEMINPLNFQNKLEIYIKRKKSPQRIEEEKKVLDRTKFSKVFNTSSDIGQFGRRWARMDTKQPENGNELQVRRSMKRSTSSFTAKLIKKLESSKQGVPNGENEQSQSVSPQIDPYYFELFHREVLSVQKELPTSLELPVGVTEIRLQHSRYHATIPHSNVDSVLYSKSHMMANLAIFEKLKAPKPLPRGDPLWAYYVRKYGRANVPPTPRKLSLKDVRETIFQVYLLEFSHPKKYGSFKKAPEMAELLDVYLLKEYGVSEIAQKVYYETLRSVQYFGREREFRDIRAFHNCIMGRAGTVLGRSMSVCWRFAEWIYRKESAQDVRVIVTEQKHLHLEDLREELFPKLYKNVGLRDIDLIIEDLSTFYTSGDTDQKTSQPMTPGRKLKRSNTEKVIKKRSFLMAELLEFLFFRIEKSREYWCRKFLEDQMKILEKVKIYKHEFSQVMAKIAPRFSGEDVDFRFDEMCKYQQGHQMDAIKLSTIFSMFNFMESYLNDKEV